MSETENGNGMTPSELEGSSAAAAGLSREVALVDEIRRHLLAGINTAMKLESKTPNPTSEEIAAEFMGGELEAALNALHHLDKAIRSRLLPAAAVERASREDVDSNHTPPLGDGKAVALTDIKREIANIKNELNGMALIGCTPLWSSLIARMDDLYERLSASPPPSLGEPATGEVGELIAHLIERSRWRNERMQCIADPTKLEAAASALARLPSERDAAREEEREACAKIADYYRDHSKSRAAEEKARDIAESIRARSALPDSGDAR